jgi:SAM-dependent methyltransferase
VTSEPGFLRDTRDAYDLVAVDYAGVFRNELASKPWARSFLGVFAQLVHAAGSGPVVDVGCGTGLVTAHLASLGLDVRGVDLSPGMLAVARRNNPGLRFDEASMTDLRLPVANFTGLVAWYSIVHVPPKHRPDVFSSFARALAPGGYALVSFQVRDRADRRREAFGHAIDLTFQPATVNGVARQLEDAGLPVQVRLVREADDDERSPHAHLLARKATG